jgi:hypothetical protein
VRVDDEEGNKRSGDKDKTEGIEGEREAMN